MTPQELALSELIWAVLYIIMFFFVRAPIIHFFVSTHPIRLLYHFVLPVLLGLNMGNAVVNFDLVS